MPGKHCSARAGVGPSAQPVSDVCWAWQFEVWVPRGDSLPGYWVEGGLEQTWLCGSSEGETDIRGWGKEVGNLSICWRKGLRAEDVGEVGGARRAQA